MQANYIFLDQGSQFLVVDSHALYVLYKTFLEGLVACITIYQQLNCIFIFHHRLCLLSYCLSAGTRIMKWLLLLQKIWSGNFLIIWIFICWWHICLDDLLLVCRLPNCLFITIWRILVDGGKKLQKTCCCKILQLIPDVAHYIVSRKCCHC
jgi:hypothetical protein